MPFKLDDLHKLEVSSIPTQDVVDPESLITAIIKVGSPDYVPKNVQVRSKISPSILTCEFLAKVLTQLEKDGKVESISINQTLNSEASAKRTNVG